MENEKKIDWEKIAKGEPEKNENKTTCEFGKSSSSWSESEKPNGCFKRKGIWINPTVSCCFVDGDFECDTNREKECCCYRKSKGD